MEAPAVASLRLTSFIGGKFLSPAEGRRQPVLNPWTGEEMAQVSHASASDVSVAVAAARHAFDSGDWSRLSPADRGAALRAIAAGLHARREELAHVESLNAGKPFSGALQEVDGAVRVFTYYSGAMDKFFGDTISQGANLLNFTLREPLGVVAQIVPWNFPILGASWKLAPALAAGCCSLLKPAPATPLSALLLAEIIDNAGIPAGVVNVLPGGVDVGRLLCCDEDIDGISFTGSTAVGSDIMRTAAATIKRLALELGGKNASVIFANADLKRAAVLAAGSAFGNAGQSCSARSRLLVERSAIPAFIEAFKQATDNLKPGNPLDPDTTYGPLISEAHRQSVAQSVQVALSKGAHLVCGGRQMSREGFFFEPTILSEVTPQNPAFTQEIFGPVCSITPFESEEEAVRLANQSEYGLNGSVWGCDIGQTLRVARAIRTGMVAINGLPSASRNSVFAPFGGYKRSGIGRELGLKALDFYTEIKTVMIDHG